MTELPVYPDLKGASVFITGGGSGIGASLTEGFLRQGAKVAFVQRSDAGGFCDRMERETGNRPLFVACDITDVAALKAAVGRAAVAHGPVRVLVNNAANDQRHETLAVDEAFWDWSMAINLKAYFFAIQAVVPGMRAAGGGAVVNFSSISYMMGNAGYPVYTTANSGINGMTRSLAREFGPDRIRVNALAPDLTGRVAADAAATLAAADAGKDFVALHARHGHCGVFERDFVNAVSIVPIAHSERVDVETAWGYGGPLIASSNNSLDEPLGCGSSSDGAHVLRGHLRSLLGNAFLLLGGEDLNVARTGEERCG